MTSQEINNDCDTGKDPMWEIAYQLAVMNEREDVPKLKTNPFGVAHDEASKGDAVASDCAEVIDAAQAVLINRRDQDFRRLRAALDRIPQSVPSPPPETAGQDSSPTMSDLKLNHEILKVWAQARDLMKKTDREQS